MQRCHLEILSPMSICYREKYEIGRPSRHCHVDPADQGRGNWVTLSQCDTVLNKLEHSLHRSKCVPAHVPMLRSVLGRGGRDDIYFLSPSLPESEVTKARCSRGATVTVELLGGGWAGDVTTHGKTLIQRLRPPSYSASWSIPMIFQAPAWWMQGDAVTLILNSQ